MILPWNCGPSWWEIFSFSSAAGLMALTDSWYSVSAFSIAARPRCKLSLVASSSANYSFSSGSSSSSSFFTWTRGSMDCRTFRSIWRPLMRAWLAAASLSNITSLLLASFKVWMILRLSMVGCWQCCVFQMSWRDRMVDVVKQLKMLFHACKSVTRLENDWPRILRPLYSSTTIYACHVIVVNSCGGRIRVEYS